MLVLARKPGEKITLTATGEYHGEPIAIVFMEMRGGEARIGIDAPRSVLVVRDDAKNTTQKDRS